MAGEFVNLLDEKIPHDHDLLDVRSDLLRDLSGRSHHVEIITGFRVIAFPEHCEPSRHFGQAFLAAGLLSFSHSFAIGLGRNAQQSEGVSEHG